MMMNRCIAIFTLFIAGWNLALGGNTSLTMQEIADSCYSYLESHLCEGNKWGKHYHFYRPALEKYSPDQWLWDSGSHMIVWSHRNITNAVLELRTMLQFQQPSGFIPEEIFWSDRSPKDEVALRMEYSNLQFSDITQMPVLPFSLRAMVNQSSLSSVERRAILKEFVPPLVNYFKWWRNTRDTGDGLVYIIHNWESGLDASPAYDPAFSVYVTEVNTKSWWELYPRFLELIGTYNFVYHWNMTEILSRPSAGEKTADKDKLTTFFKVKDLAVNSVYAAGWEVLAELAREMGDLEMAQDCHREYQTSLSAITGKMFIASQGHYNSLYLDPATGEEKASVANSVQNLFPLLLKDLPRDHVDLLVAQLSDPNKFNAPFMIPTVALDDPQFCATFEIDLMWRGPVWGFTNWFVMEGLGVQKQFALQKQVLDKWVALVSQSGIYEHYNPISGEPYGSEGLGMSTLVCDWIYRYDLL